jgi:hypothetical protein
MAPLSILPHLKQLVDPVGQKTAAFLFLHFGRCTTALQLHSPKEKYVRQNGAGGMRVRSEKTCPRTQYIESIRKLCDNKSLPKLIEEYNYMFYRRPNDFWNFAKTMRERCEITSQEYGRITQTIRPS